MDRDALPRLTVLRFWAALLVVCYHLSRQGGHRVSVVSDLAWYGRDGVSLFFVLSGTVLAWTYTRQDTPARLFWRRRFARIWPLHALTTLLWTALSDAAPVPVLASLALLQSWSRTWAPGVDPASWSLSAEAWFYLLFPLLLRLLTPRRTRTLAVLAAACALAGPLLWPLGSLVADPATRSWLLDYLPLTRTPQFVLGLAVGLLLRRGLLRRIPLPPVLAALLTLHLLFVPWSAAVPDRLWYSPYSASQLLAAPLFALLIAACAGRDLLPARRPHRYLLALGHWSFAWYLVHQAFLRPAHGSWAATLLLSTAAAGLLYRCVERPLERRLRGGRADGGSVVAVVQVDVAEDRAELVPVQVGVEGEGHRGVAGREQR